MRYGFWTPVFGGWLRNIPDEHMAATWDYTKRLCQRAEKIGYDLTLVAELNLNDIKGTDQPALDAWSTAAALAAVTDTLELMVAEGALYRLAEVYRAIHPTFVLTHALRDPYNHDHPAVADFAQADYKKDCKPVFVSAGHLSDLQSAIALVMASVTKYRLPEPVRAAHKAAGIFEQ